jgi:hypothetical protein
MEASSKGKRAEIRVSAPTPRSQDERLRMAIAVTRIAGSLATEKIGRERIRRGD